MLVRESPHRSHMHIPWALPEIHGTRGRADKLMKIELKLGEDLGPEASLEVIGGEVVVGKPLHVS